MTSRSVPHADWRRFAALCGLLAAVWPARAGAQESVDLTWDSPPECPQETAVRQSLRSLVGEDIWHRPTHLNATGRIERVGERYRLTLSVRDGTEVKERKIDSDSCADLGGAAAVTLGLLLKRASNPDSSRSDAGATSANGSPNGSAGAGSTNQNAAQPAAPAPKPPAKKGEPSSDAASEQEPDAPDTTDARRFHFVLRAPLVAVDFVRLPKPSFGLGGGIGARYDEWQFIALGRFLWPQTVQAEQFPGMGLSTHVTRFAVELWTCRGFRSQAFEFSPCFTLGLDHLTARAVGPWNVTPRSEQSTSALIGGAAAFHYYLADWSALFASAAVAVATSQPSFSLDGLGEIGHVGPVQVSAGIGSEWIF